jgi:membrane protein
VAHDTLSKLKRLQEQALAFFHETGIGRVDDAQRSRSHRFAHFCLLVGKSFIRNRCPVRASALAYTTLLALIPMLAVCVSITTGLLQKEGEKPVRELIDHLVANVAPALNLQVQTGDAAAASKRQEVVTKITDFIANIQSGTIGVTGIIALVFVAIGLLRTIEATFNDIWGVTRGRGWGASIVQYGFTIAFGPVVLVLVLGLTTGPHFKDTTKFLEHWPWLGSFVFYLLPYVVLSLAFALFYQLVPNTRVQPPAALVGGIVGGTLWQLNNKLSVLYVSKAVSYGQVYGSLSILPLFLIGMYFSWLILLFGAQVAYAFQNRQSYLQEKQAEGVNQRGREFVALRVMTSVARHFQRGARPPGINQLATSLGVPSRLVTQIMHPLLQAKLLVEVLDKETGYVPARPLQHISAHDVLTALRAGQGMELETADDGARGLVRGKFESICDAERDVAAALTLESLANEAPPAPVVALPAPTSPPPFPARRIERD